MNWIEFFRSVGVPTTICLVFMYGVYRVLSAILMPVAESLITAVNHTMRTNQEICRELKELQKQSGCARELAAMVTQRMDNCHEEQRKDHEQIMEYLRKKE